MEAIFWLLCLNNLPCVHAEYSKFRSIEMQNTIMEEAPIREAIVLNRLSDIVKIRTPELKKAD